MERRVLIAITLSFLVLFLFQRFVMPPPVETPVSQSVATGGNLSAPAPGSMAAIAPSSNQSATAPAVTAPATPGAPGAPAAPAVTVGETADREIVVETATVK